MRRYSIRYYANPVVRRKMCLCDWCDILLDVATPNITSLNSVVFDDDDINRYNASRNIKHVSKSAKFIMLDIRIDCNRRRSLRDLV